jgi:hypothetical protein
MKATLRIYLAAGVLAALALPKPSLAIDGCTTAYLSGTYNAQITNIAIQSVAGAVNGATAGQTTAAGLPGGFSSSPSSISGNTPGLARFFFDGNGNILGLAAGSASTALSYAPVGLYAVASNCTAAFYLNSGQHYNGVVVAGGNAVLFVQSDAGSNGVTGILQRSANSCSASQYPQSFGFQLYGATAQTAAPQGAAPAVPAVSVTPYSVVGLLNLDGNGNFTITQFQYGAFGTELANGSGTYTVGANCVLNLAFATGASSSITPPASFAALISGTVMGSSMGATGMIALQPVSGQVISGAVISQ